MATVTPVAPGGQGLPPGVSIDPISGILIFRGQLIPAGSYEGVLQIVAAINSRRRVTFQDYDRNVGAVTRTYDPVTGAQAVGPALPGTTVAAATQTNPAQGVRINPANPPNTAAASPAAEPQDLSVAPQPQANPPDPTVNDPGEVPGVTVNPVSTLVPDSTEPVPAVPLARVRTAPENNLIFDPATGELLPADSAAAEQILIEQEQIENEQAAFDGFETELENLRLAQLRETENFESADFIPPPVNPDQDPQAAPQGLPFDDNGVLNVGWALDGDGEPVFIGADFVDPGLQASAFESRSVNAQAMITAARDQATLAAQRKAEGTAAGDGDWRVRLRLAPSAGYLYKDQTPGILQPLADTDGVIFPYTPEILTAYTAEYSPYDLTHNNYRGYFYKGSRVGEVLLTADFTAQDTAEANYLLAVIHFFKSCTKMFYGQDAERGSPPPLVYLTGLGEYQFNEHACVISNFNYSLPSNVDYIRARSTMASSAGVTQGGNGLMFQRRLASSATPSYSLDAIIARLTGANLPQGAVS